MWSLIQRLSKACLKGVEMQSTGFSRTREDKLLKNIYLFIWLCWVLVERPNMLDICYVMRGLFNAAQGLSPCGMQAQ